MLSFFTACPIVCEFFRMTGLLECLDKVEYCLSNAEKLEASVLSERKSQLASLQHRIDELKLAQSEADKELRRALEDTEFLQPAEKRKLLRIMGKLTLAESQKISEEWRVFVGKFLCTQDVQENWNSLKRALLLLTSR
jgi:hypothetical protein